MSAPILHGRRRGQNREFDQLQSAQMKVMGTNLRDTTVLTRDDWNRIQFQLNKRVIEQERLREARQERENLRNISKERVKNWSNTFAGQRQKKLESRKLREDKEEEEKKVMDIEEAKFQSEKRKEAIEKAKTQQYYQTDRVKGFHGALLLTEVLKERDAQVELKRLKAAASTGQDQDWLVRTQHEYDAAVLKDQDAAREKLQAARDAAAFQKAQINYHAGERARESDYLAVEGEELKRLAAVNALEKERLEAVRKAEAATLMTDNVRQIDDVRRMRDVQKAQDEEENEECRIFAAAKRKMMKLRSKKEKELHNQKQERLERIRQKLYAQMQQQKDDEDVRIKRAVEESEERRAREEATKEAWTRKMQDDINQHRVQQLEEKDRAASEDRRRELEMLAVRRDADALFAENEAEKNHRKMGTNKDLQDFHSRQMGERDANQRVAREEQLALDRRNEEVVLLEEKQFQEYSRRVIDHCDKGGRNTYPLIRAAREGAGGGLGPVFPGKGGVRPSYMAADQSGVQLPNYQRGTTEETKDNIYGKAPSNKRLGFVW